MMDSFVLHAAAHTVIIFHYSPVTAQALSGRGGGVVLVMEYSLHKKKRAMFFFSFRHHVNRSSYLKILCK
jgi:hypothetical protein